MSSQYPSDCKTEEDKQMYFMRQASIYLSRINSDNTEVDTSSVRKQIDKDKEELKTEYFENQFHEIALDDYIWNHVDEVKELLTTDSIDKRVKLLNNARNQIMGRFGRYSPDEPTYDELEQYIRQAVIDAKNETGAPGEYYDDLDI